MNFNLSDSKKKLALAGVVCGLVAAVLAYFGNPANMAIMYRLLYPRHGRGPRPAPAAVVQYARPEIIGIVIGAFRHLRGDKGVPLHSRIFPDDPFCPGAWSS